MKWYQRWATFWENLLRSLEFHEDPPKAPTMPVQPSNPPPMNPDTLLPWNTTTSLSHENWHNVRVLADLEGLSVEMKDELCATVWGESEFNIHARLDNKDKVGCVWSSDLGICQYNTYFHPDVVSLPYTPDPEREVRTMCREFKAGQANQWVAHSSGRYKLFLGKTL